jgi:hypothetical protein
MKTERSAPPKLPRRQDSGNPKAPGILKEVKARASKQSVIPQLFGERRAAP